MIFDRNKVQNMNKMIVGLVLATMTTTALAQSGSNSPYSQYGLGDLTDQSVGFNKGMNGVGLAMRKGYEVNPMNPASYSSVDSLSMIFDAGLTGQLTNFNEKGTRVNAKNGSFDYAVALFRVAKNVGVSFGIMPFSNIGYNYYVKEPIDTEGYESIKNKGNGGVHQLYLGTGIRFFKQLSLGVNIAYLWGEYERTISTTNTTINMLSKEYSADISNYKLDVGLQFEQKVGKNDYLTIGATWSPGHSLKSDAYRSIISYNSTISKNDTTTLKIEDAYKMATSFGVGLGYNHAQKLRAGVDFTMQKWGNIDFPYDNGNTYELKKGLLKDNFRLNAGVEWLPKLMSRNFFERVRYRIGVGYATPYYYINGQEGPKDLSASIGFGIPIVNGYNNRSILNISAQYVHRSAENLIKENSFRISIGLTFNERWFAQWKVE